MRNKFDEQLHSLDEQLTHMGELCETAIAKATQALNSAAAGCKGPQKNFSGA